MHFYSRSFVCHILYRSSQDPSLYFSCKFDFIYLHEVPSSLLIIFFLENILRAPERFQMWCLLKKVYEYIYLLQHQSLQTFTHSIRQHALTQYCDNIYQRSKGWIMLLTLSLAFIVPNLFARTQNLIARHGLLCHQQLVKNLSNFWEDILLIA